MFQLWMSLVLLFVLPVAAVLGGLVTWVLTRGEEPDDGTLVKHFVVSTGMFVLVSAAIPRTDWFLDRYDPVRLADKALVALPAHAALRASKPWEWQQLEPRVAEAARAQVPLPEILSMARVTHMRLARHYLPWAPGSTTLRYANAVLPALQELQATDAAACTRLAWPRAGGPFDADGRISAPVGRELQLAMAEILSRADLEYGASERFKREDPASQSYDLGELQRTYSAMRQELEQRHGDIVGKLHTAEIAALPPDRACAATIDLFTRALQQRPPIARGLLANMLRT